MDSKELMNIKQGNVPQVMNLNEQQNMNMVGAALEVDVTRQDNNKQYEEQNDKQKNILEKLDKKTVNIGDANQFPVVRQQKQQQKEEEDGLEIWDEETTVELTKETEDIEKRYKELTEGYRKKTLSKADFNQGLENLYRELEPERRFYQKSMDNNEKRILQQYNKVRKKVTNAHKAYAAYYLDHQEENMETVQTADQQTLQGEILQSVEEMYEGEMQQYKIEIWNDNIAEILQKETEIFNGYLEKLDKSYEKNEISRTQYCWKLRIVIDSMGFRKFNLVGAEEKSREIVQAYYDVYEKMSAAFAEKSVDIEKDSQGRIINPMKTFIENKPFEEGTLLDAKLAEEMEKPEILDTERLGHLDKWLLMKYEKEDGCAKDSMVYHFLRRSKSERLFAYYLMENGFSSKLASQEVLTFRPEEYHPNENRIMRKGFNLSDFEKIYRQMCQASPMLLSMNTLNRMEDAIEEEPENLGNFKELVAQTNEVRKALDELEEEKRRYDDSNFIMKKFRKKNVTKALKKLAGEFDTLLGMKLKVNGQDEISNVMDYVKFSILGTSGAKVGVGVLGAKMADSDLARIQIAGGKTLIGANVVGGLLGLVNFSLALAGVFKAYKAMSLMTDMNRAAMIMDLISQFGSSTSSIASSVNGVLKVAQLSSDAAGVATSAAGIVTGMATAGVGIFKLGAESVDYEQSKNAYHDLALLRLRQQFEHPISAEEQMVLDKNVHFEKNLEIIRDRIHKRNQITAATQMVGGIMTAASSAMTLVGGGALAAVTGILGMATLVGGALATHIMKRLSYKKVVDEFLDLDTLVYKQGLAMEEDGKKLTKKQNEKIKERMRRDLMETYGYTSVKEFYLFIMTVYAKNIYEKIRPVLNDPELKMNKEQQSYVSIVEGLGLRINHKKKCPTAEMIFSKLTS